MSSSEEDYEDDYEDGYENNYKNFQERYESLHKEWKDESDDWSDERKHRHLENMKIANDEEIQGREEAAEEWGEDADEGHAQRIDIVRGTSQLLGHDMAHVSGEYEYQTGRMQDMDEDLSRELEEGNDGRIFERWEHERAVEGGYAEEREEDEEANDEEANDEDSNMDIVSDSD